VILAIVLALLVGGGLLAFVLANQPGGTTGGAATPIQAPPTEPPPAPPTELPPPTEPPSLPATDAPTAVPPTAPPAPTATPAPEPTLAPIPPTPRPTATPQPPTPTTPPDTPTATPAPTDTPTATPCPTLPTSGFGKLWNDNQQLRERIGCPTAPEQGGAGTIAEQPYQRGSMFYYQPSERIYALLGKDSGEWRRYEQSELATLPTPAPDAETPCRTPPISGFGLVWSNFADVRDALGCPTGPEDGLLEGAYQPFEQGEMLFSQKGLGRGKTIYVLYEDGKFERYDDTNP
jgi:serine/threonine-protein kinase